MKTVRFQTDPMLLLGAVAALTGITSACFSDNVDNTRAILEAESKSRAQSMVEIMTDDGEVAVKSAPSTVRVPGGDVAVIYEAPDIETLIEPTLLTLAEQEAVVDEAKSFDEFMDLGSAEVAAGNFQGAIASFRRALGSQVASSEAWHELGRAYLRNGERARGVLCLEESIERNVENADSYAVLSRVYLSSRDSESAISYANTLARLRPKAFRGHFLLGRAYSQSEMWSEAISSYEKSLEIEPGNVFANNNLGYAALQIGKYDMAVFALEVASAQPNAKPFMLNSLGIAYERLGEPFNAMAAYDRALDVRPGYVKAIVNRERLDGAFTDAQRDEYAAMIAVRDAELEELALANPEEGGTDESSEEASAMAGGTVMDDESQIVGMADVEPPSFTEEIAEQP